MYLVVLLNFSILFLFSQDKFNWILGMFMFLWWSICGESVIHSIYLDECRKTIPVEEILTINIKPRWKKGMKTTFPEKGNEQLNVIPSDRVFIIDEKPHSVFTHDGNDLVVTQKIPLAEALTGHTVRLTTLDGRNLSVPINNVIHPNYEEVVPREGMCRSLKTRRKRETSESNSTPSSWPHNNKILSSIK